jgi:hypothetical protein
MSVLQMEGMKMDRFFVVFWTVGGTVDGDGFFGFGMAGTTREPDGGGIVQKEDELNVEVKVKVEFEDSKIPRSKVLISFNKSEVNKSEVKCRLSRQ